MFTNPTLPFDASPMHHQCCFVARRHLQRHSQRLRRRPVRTIRHTQGEAQSAEVDVVGLLATLSPC